MPDGGGLPVALAARLRALGVAVPVEATVSFARALAELPDHGVAGAYWAGRITLVHHPDDVAAFDRAFTELVGGPADDDVTGVARTVAVGLDGPGADPPTGDTGDDDEPGDGEVRAVRWSAVERLRTTDLAACTDEELAEAHRLIAHLRLRTVLRPTRRHHPDRSPRAGGRIDLRRTAADAVRHGGEVGRPATSSPGTRPRRVAFLLDVSGSMRPYSRAFALVAHAAVAARPHGRVEVFALGTRLTRITRELRSHDPDAALAAAARVVVDWDGGTRLGEGFRAFNDTWGVRGPGRGAVVVVLSDGWDRGDTDLLGAELARLRRVAHRLVWANPLTASPGYEPLAGGMAAALPHVDDLVAGHSVAALEDLVALLAGEARPVTRGVPHRSGPGGPPE